MKLDQPPSFTPVDGSWHPRFDAAINRLQPSTVPDSILLNGITLCLWGLDQRAENSVANVSKDTLPMIGLWMRS